MNIDDRGKLTICENVEDSLPFIPVRVFFISDVDPMKNRAEHAVSCDLVLLVLTGSVSVEIHENEEPVSTVHLSGNAEGLLIKKNTYIVLTNFKNETIVAVFASKLYKDTHYSL